MERMGIKDDHNRSTDTFESSGRKPAVLPNVLKSREIKKTETTTKEKTRTE
jgi:hypothetical protein